MSARFTRSLASIALSLVVLSPAYAATGLTADERSDSGRISSPGPCDERPAPGDASAEATATPEPTTQPLPDLSATSDRLGRAQIFEILRGGDDSADPGLLEHLWQVAGSLAGAGWRPPSVTVRVVASAVPPSPLPY